MKKLAVLLFALLFCMIAFSEEKFIRSGDYEYRVLEDGTAEITDYKGDERRIRVPGVLDDYTVTQIGDSAFNRCYSAESIILPDSIRKIGDSAFYNCQFKSFTIPEGVTEIGSGAFNSCYSLESLIVPDSVRSIGSAAFIGCGEVYLPDHITRIENYTFTECTFSEITLPSQLTFLGGAAFSRAEIKKITIPACVTMILGNTFYGCRFLTSVVLPSTVRVIEGYAFDGCISLENVYIPESVTMIDDYAFNDANPDLTIICVKGSKAEEFARNEGFNYEYPTSEEEEMRNFSYMPNADGSLTVTGYNGKRTEISIPASIDGKTVTAVAPASFVGVNKLKSVTLPDTLTEIGEYAFLGCKELEILTIPKSVIKLASAVGAYCPNLTFKVVENAPAHDYALENGFKFELYALAQKENAPFTTIQNSDGSLSIGKYIGSDTVVVVPSRIDGKPVTAISSMAFPVSLPVTSVTLPEGLIKIGDFCFLGSETLETLVIPASVAEIGNGIGLYCPKLTCFVQKDSFAHSYVESVGIPFELIEE